MPFRSRAQLRFPLLLLSMGTVVLAAGCGSTQPSDPAPPLPRGIEGSAARIAAQIHETPDSLKTLPAPQFYRSPTPRPAPAQTEGKARASIEVVGAIVDGRAQWGLLVRAMAPDSSFLRSYPFVDLYATRLVMRRGQAWRTLKAKGDSLLDIRYVPVSRQDVQRLARTDTMMLAVNAARFRLPSSLRIDFQRLNRATPDSLASDTAGVETLFTVYHDPETEPKMEEELISNMDQMGKVIEKLPLGQSEKIVFRFLVHQDGTVTPLEVLRGGSPRVAVSFLRLLKKQTVEPGSHKGNPVPTVLRLPITFRSR